MVGRREDGWRKKMVGKEKRWYGREEIIESKRRWCAEKRLYGC